MKAYRIIGFIMTACLILLGSFVGKGGDARAGDEKMELQKDLTLFQERSARINAEFELTKARIQDLSLYQERADRLMAEFRQNEFRIQQIQQKLRALSEKEQVEKARAEEDKKKPAEKPPEPPIGP